jgi:hypothetical protein
MLLAFALMRATVELEQERAESKAMAKELFKIIDEYEDIIDNNCLLIPDSVEH